MARPEEFFHARKRPLRRRGQRGEVLTLLQGPIREGDSGELSDASRGWGSKKVVGGNPKCPEGEGESM